MISIYLLPDCSVKMLLSIEAKPVAIVRIYGIFQLFQNDKRKRV